MGIKNMFSNFNKSPKVSASDSHKLEKGKLLEAQGYYMEAFKHYQEAAKRGDTYAQIRVGEYYQQGHAVSR